LGLSWLNDEYAPAVMRACNPQLFVLLFQLLAGDPSNEVMSMHPGQAAAINLRRLDCFKLTMGPA
jgi:hypothetical protein